MKKILTLLYLALAFVPAVAQNKADFLYDVNFEYNFDNREFDVGECLYTPSFTINAARLTPTVGVGFRQNSHIYHRVMAGIDVMRNMGEAPTGSEDLNLNNSSTFREMPVWYNIEAQLPNSIVNGYAGMFPRRYSVFGASNTSLSEVSGRNISSAFLSDENRFYDNNLEGFMFNALRRHSYYELGLDWMGMYGSNRREQFQVFTYGKTDFNSWLSAGWVGTFHHYANSVEARGVVDDNLTSIFVDFNFADIFGLDMQLLDLSLSSLQGFHQDRAAETGIDLVYGGQAIIDARNWNVGIHNEAYYGTGLYPYFSSISPEGTAYGTDLYRGNPLYQVKGAEGDWSKAGFYDRLEAYYQPHIASFIDLKVSFVFHLTEGGFQGWQQKLGLVFNLEKARTAKSAKKKNPAMKDFFPFELYL